MKPTKYILILLSLFLTFSCDEDTQTNEDTDDMMSLDWILLMNSVSTNFYVESCDGYIEYEDGYDEFVGYECRCNNYDNECGECKTKTINTFRVNSCSGYELCEYGYSSYGDMTILSYYDCCYDYELKIYQYDEDGNTIDEYDENFNWIGETEIIYRYRKYLFNEYTLYWNDDLNVCDGSSCDEEDIDDYDIVIPSHIPNWGTTDCDNSSGGNGCESEMFFHPNCDTPLDTTMMIGNKSVSIEKMGWFGRDWNGWGDGGEKGGYIHYYPLDKYLIFEGDDDLDISSYKIVDYQRKE